MADDADAKPLSPAADSQYELIVLRKEAAGLVEHAELSIDKASRLVGLHPSEYRRPARPCYMPLPAEIAAKCAEFRKGWGPTDRKTRWMRPVIGRWTAPVVAERELFGAA